MMSIFDIIKIFMTKITNVNMEEMSVAKYFLTDSFGHPL